MLRPKYVNLDGNQRTDDNNETPLYIDHFLAGFLILSVGLLISVVIFVTERCSSKKDSDIDLTPSLTKMMY